VCVSSLIYLTCNAHALYYIIMYFVSDSSISFNIISKKYFFRNDLWKKCDFLIYLNFFSVKFLISKRIQTDIVLKVHFSSCNYCKYLVKNERFLSFWKSLQTLFFNLSCGSQRTDITNLAATFFLKFVKRLIYFTLSHI